MLLPAKQREYLPILISSSVSASPIHSNWKSCKDCENFCTAMDKSRIQEKKNQNYYTRTSLEQGIMHFCIKYFFCLQSFLTSIFFGHQPNFKITFIISKSNTWVILDTYETDWWKISNINMHITFTTKEPL